MSKVRIIFGLAWFLLSLLCVVIWYSLTFGGSTISASGADKTSPAGYLYLGAGIVFAIVAGGVYLQRKLSLLVVFPVLVFSLIWFLDVLTDEHFWLKYALASSAILIVCFGSVFSVCRRT
ncbi:hypothetical protein ACJJI4_13790 [Microbulbifer sp. TRSA002]|uniref:hypothetical protein n=1 Tax=unclassified Microbulbifer TaxID=2619833 RepID=UPI0040398A9F